MFVHMYNKQDSKNRCFWEDLDGIVPTAYLPASAPSPLCCGEKMSRKSAEAWRRGTGISMIFTRRTSLREDERNWVEWPS